MRVARDLTVFVSKHPLQLLFIEVLQRPIEFTQYAARAYQQLLADHDIVCSMSRRANCWDNACVESFFSTLKRELPNDHVFEDWHEVDRAVFAYVDAHYNTRRPHSALGYLTPNAYEQRAA
ncbi:MAG TPA: integrase core domain-containing protein [Kofleriaceae bacterium]